MLKRTMKYALSLAAGAALLAVASSGAGAMTVSMLPGATPAAQVTSALLDESTDAAKIENVFWCGRWGCHPGGPGYWRGPGWRGPGWGPGYGPGGPGYGGHRRWCYWHPRACGY